MLKNQLYEEDLEEIVKGTFLKIGVRENKEVGVLDFGCGSGTYTIPLAEIIGQIFN